MEVGFHIFLRIIIIPVLYYLGVKLENTKSPCSFIKIGFWVVVVFSFFIGLRYGRGVDYTHYLEMYRLAEEERGQYILRFLNNILRTLDAPFYYATILYEIIFSIGLLYICKLYKKYSRLILPLIVLVDIGAMENLIRQFLALGPLFIAFYYFHKRKLLCSSIFYLISVLTHFSSLVVIPIYIFFSAYSSWKIRFGFIYVFLYLLLCFLWDTSYLSNYIFLFNYISGGDFVFSGYVDNAERWFTNEGSLGFKISPIQFYRIVISNSILLLLGYKVSQKYNNFTIYHLFFVGLIIYTLAGNGNIELLYRISMFFLPLFRVLLISIITLEYFKHVNYRFAVYFLYLNIFYEYTYPFRSLKLNDSLYIWDVPSNYLWPI